MDEANFEKAQKLLDRLGDVFTEENLEVGVVLSVLVSMLVSTALNQTNMTGVELLRLFSQGVEKYEDAVKNEMEEDDGEVISRTTH